MTKPKYIYLVGSADVESSFVRFACTTKKKARERFEKVRKEIIDFFEGASYAEKNKKMFPDYYEILKNITFDNMDAQAMYTVQETPFWRRIKLDD